MVLENVLASHYGIQVVRVVRLPLGADPNSSVYKADARDGLSYFVKLKRGSGHIGITIMELLHAARIEGIIPPIQTTDGRSSLRLNDLTLIVYPFVEGQDGFSRKLTNEQWITLGTILKRVHSINLPSFIENQVRHESYSSRWRDAVRALYSQMDAEPIRNETASKLITFLKENATTINRLVDRSDELASKLQHEKHPFVLCHSDIHAGNVLLNGDDAFYIVDWDEPIMAPKERDLMFIGGGVANVWNEAREDELFYQGYGRTDVNSELIAYYRHERIVEDIAVDGQELILTTAGGDERANIYENFMSMFEANGVVDIALKSDPLPET